MVFNVGLTKIKHSTLYIMFIFAIVCIYLVFCRFDLGIAFDTRFHELYFDFSVAFDTRFD